MGPWHIGMCSTRAPCMQFKNRDKMRFYSNGKRKGDQMKCVHIYVHTYIFKVNKLLGIHEIESADK